MVFTPDPAYDIILDGKGYMLARANDDGSGGRAWAVETIGSSIASQTSTESHYGNQPAIVEAPMVWNTAHLGYGDSETRGEGRYHYAINIDARFPQQIIPGPAVTEITIDGSANVNKIFEVRGELYCLAGRYCKRIGLDDTVTTEKDFGIGKVASDAGIYNATLYVGMGSNDPFWYWSMEDDGIWGRSIWDGGDEWRSTSSWTQATALYMNRIAVFKDRLWASVNNYQVRCVASDPTSAANWSAVYNVGDPGLDITSLAEMGELLYIGKEDGLYALGSDGRAQRLTPELAGFVSADNCINMKSWHGQLWVPNLRGFFAYQNLGESGFGITAATPGAEAANETPVRGRITAMAGDNRWLYVALYTESGDTYILAGREARGNETIYGPIIWHPLVWLSGTRCDAMHISGIWANPRLFFGMGANLGYIILPRNGDNPLMDENCRYVTKGTLYFAAHDWDTPTTRKLFKSIEVLSERVSSTRYAEVYYRVDAQAWKYAGRANLPPRHVLALPEKGVAGNKIEIRLDLTSTATAPPVVRAVVVRGVERPSTVEIITMRIRCADNLPLRTGAKSTRRASSILADLKTLSTKSSAVKLKDTTGYERYVIVLPGIQEQEIAQEDTRLRELLLTVRMVEFKTMPIEDQTYADGIWGYSSWGEGDLWQ